MANEPKELDTWQKALEIKLVELQSCQSTKKIDSCLKCELTLDCALRKEYVKAVYESMSKGSMGGFEF